MLLADEIVERPRSDPVRKRREHVPARSRGVAEEVAHPASMLTAMSATGEDFDTPVLPGAAASDYERYVRTDGLLALQKGPDDRMRRKGLISRVVYQSSERSPRRAACDAAEAVPLVKAGQLEEAARQLRRPLSRLRFVTEQLDMLEELSPRGSQDVPNGLTTGPKVEA